MKKSELEIIQNRIRTYITDILNDAPIGEGNALASQNMYMYVYLQSGVAIARDILAILEGTKITTIAEYKQQIADHMKQQQDKHNGMVFQ